MNINKTCIYPFLLSAIICSGSAGAATGHAGKRTAAMDSALWAGSEWISAAEAPVVTGRIEGINEQAADGASWFLTTIRNDKKVSSARWMTSGLGVFYLYVNGKPVGEEVLKPGFTHYAKTKLSFTYDVTDAISRKKDAENTFSVQVTPGWWGDKIITPGGNEGMLGRKVAFRGVLELTFSDGSKKYYGTNTRDWQAGIAGPVRHAAIFDGEEYDAREAEGFMNAAALGKAETNSEFAGGIFPSEGAEIYRREDLALRPVNAYTWQGVTDATDDAFGKIIVSR